MLEPVAVSANGAGGREERASWLRELGLGAVEEWYVARLTDLVALPSRREIFEGLPGSAVALDAEAAMLFVSVAIVQLGVDADVLATVRVVRLEVRA